MRNLLLTFGLLLTLCNSAPAQIDDAVRKQAAGLVVSGKASHSLDQEIPRLEAIRQKILDSVGHKLREPKIDLTAELKALERFEKYCTRMSELVAVQHPDASQTKAWLEASAAVAGLINIDLAGPKDAVGATFKSLVCPK